ncbi:MAG TPA: ATP-binding protein [Bryobacteraceae bacterium]|nr:ATP-binding protein [Bryobacteraceae bacterium]
MSAKELLNKKDAKFRLLFEDNPRPMWVFDRQTLRFLEVNQAAVAHYGYTRAEFLAMTIADIRPREDVPRLVETVAQAGVLTLGGQWRHRLKDGRIIDVEVDSHTISYGGRSAVLSVLHDVTERNQLEERLRQAAKMEAVGMLAGGIAHDFNNLLTIINGYSHILLQGLSPDDPNHSAAEQIMKAGERAAALTRQLLTFSRRQVLQPKVLDLNQLVTGLDNMLQRLIGEDIDLRVVPGNELGQVSADPGQMEQVIMNLVVNARDAMPRGGILTIETTNVMLDEHYALTHAATKPGRYVALVVSDNGAGMDANTRAHLFEPFFTTKSQGKGTGLGLTTVFGIVKQSGGNVEVYSDPGHGTSVKVYMPRLDRPAAHESAPSAARAAKGTETILLVEDDDAVRRLMGDTLRQEGYAVLDAPSAAAARRIDLAHRGPIHLLITDVVMPREGGRELAGSLVARRPAIKVLFMSGYTDAAVVNNGLLESDAAFIQKPFTPAALSAKVRETLDHNGETTHSAGGS